MRENSEEGGVGSLNYLDTTPIPLDHEIRSLTIHMNPIIRHHLNFDSSTTNLKCSVFRPFGEKHVYDHILHTERLTITNNDMCCWPFVDVILEDSPPKRRSATRAKKRVVPTAAAEQQDQHIFVSDRLHMHPGVSRVDFFDTDFLPLPPHTFLFHAITQSIPLPTTRRPTSTIIFHLRSIIPPDAKSIMGDTSFFHDYVPPSKRPKPPTPTPEAKETNPWLISAPTPNLDKASASPEPAPAQGTKQKENNPWLISAPTPNLAPAPAAQEAPAAPATPAAAASAAPAPSAPVAPAPTPAAPPFPPLVYAAFPVRIQAIFLSISLFKSSSNNPLTLEIAGYSGQQCSTSAPSPALFLRNTSPSPTPATNLVQECRSEFYCCYSSPSRHC